MRNKQLSPLHGDYWGIIDSTACRVRVVSSMPTPSSARFSPNVQSPVASVSPVRLCGAPPLTPDDCFRRCPCSGSRQRSLLHLPASPHEQPVPRTWPRHVQSFTCSLVHSLRHTPGCAQLREGCLPDLVAKFLSCESLGRVIHDPRLEPRQPTGGAGSPAINPASQLETAPHPANATPHQF